MAETAEQFRWRPRSPVFGRALRGVTATRASAFAVVLGLAGLGGSWRLAGRGWGLPAWPGEVVWGLAGLVWISLAILYGLKWILAYRVARAEADHPIHGCFVGLGGVATMLIAQGILPHARGPAAMLFVAGALLTVTFAFWQTGGLWRGGRDPESNTPVLYLPAVAGGFVTAATAGAFGWMMLGQLAFGAALFSWLAIESVLLHRLYTGRPLAPELRPTLGIQLAPSAVGAMASLALREGDPGWITFALIGYALLQAMVLLRLARWLTMAPFGLSFWSFAFGATSLTSALQRLALAQPGSHAVVLAIPAFITENVLLGLIIALTLRMLVRRRRPFPAG